MSATGPRLESTGRRLISMRARIEITRTPVISIHRRMEIAGAPVLITGRRMETARRPVISIHPRMETARRPLISIRSRIEIARAPAIATHRRVGITQSTVSGLYPAGCPPGRGCPALPSRVPPRQKRHGVCRLPGGKGGGAGPRGPGPGAGRQQATRQGAPGDRRRALTSVHQSLSPSGIPGNSATWRPLKRRDDRHGRTTAPRRPRSYRPSIGSCSPCSFAQSMAIS